MPASTSPGTSKLNQAGFAHILVLIILLTGIAVGTYLVLEGPKKFWPQAFGPRSGASTPSCQTTDNTNLCNYSDGWEAVFPASGIGGPAYGKAIATDPQGSVYVAGSIYNGQNSDIWIRKYNRDGRIGWTNIYNGADNMDDNGPQVPADSGNGIVFDHGRVYAVGYERKRTNSGLVQTNMWMRAYQESGEVIWTKDFSSDGAGKLHGIAVDKADSIYVIGEKSIPGRRGVDIFIAKYNRDGEERWLKTFTTSKTDPLGRVIAGYDRGYGLAIADNYIYAVGYEDNNAFTETSTWEEVWLSKLDREGNVLWTQRYDSPDHDHDHGYGVATDRDGNAYVAGRTVRRAPNSSNIYGNVLVLKYSPSGEKLWDKSFDLDNNWEDNAQGAAADSEGNIYIIGSQYKPGEHDNIWIWKYNSSGNLLWEKDWGGIEKTYDQGNGITVDQRGNIYVVGTEGKYHSNQRIWVRKYSNSALPSASPSTTPASGLKTSPCNNMGDVDLDGYITNNDAHVILRITTKLPDPATNQPYTDEQKRRADVNASSSVTGLDSLIVIRYLLGKESNFKACSQVSPTSVN